MVNEKGLRARRCKWWQVFLAPKPRGRHYYIKGGAGVADTYWATGWERDVIQYRKYGHQDGCSHHLKGPAGRDK